jgi:hypothetical protein
MPDTQNRARRACRASPATEFFQTAAPPIFVSEEIESSRISKIKIRDTSYTAHKRNLAVHNATTRTH